MVGHGLDRLGSPGLGRGGAWLFERALAVPGEPLRRTRKATAPRLQLTPALQAFARLGALPLADARGQRAGCGRFGPTRAVLAGEAGRILTPQEYEIAMPAASGSSNKQIGGRLYLSPRTVGAHRNRVFPMLGSSSRAALRDALSAAATASTAVPSRAG